MWRKSARRDFLKGYCRTATQKSVTLTILGWSRFGPLTSAGDGWRCSADRTGLHTNSLLTGNFTGNFAIIRPHGRYDQQETTVLPLLPERFPTKPIKENSFDKQGKENPKQGLATAAM
jgi:hypothetical protein